MEEKIDNYINNINQIFINELYNHSDNSFINIILTILIKYL